MKIVTDALDQRIELELKNIILPTPKHKIEEIITFCCEKLLFFIPSPPFELVS